MNRKKTFAVLLLTLILSVLVLPTAIFAADEPSADALAVAEQEADAAKLSSKSYGSGIAIGIAAAGGAIAMSIAVGKAAEGISRQPEAAGEIRSSMMLGLVFIETAIIYALLVVILIIFVL